jgi:nucleoside-triphosphatase THEP1
MKLFLLHPEFPITALVYSDSEAADRMLRDCAVSLLEDGYRLAGLVQINTPRPGRSRCDMVLEELASGQRLGISQDRGPQARGCALDVSQLLEAMQQVRAGLSSRPDLVILNKFGKTEAEGGGFRPLIAEAIESGVPLLIGVPWRNIENWRRFAGPLSREIQLDQINMPIRWSIASIKRDPIPPATEQACADDVSSQPFLTNRE